MFILYTHGIWFGLENRLKAYADDATLSTPISCAELKASAAESLNVDLVTVNSRCSSRKIQNMIISYSRFKTPDLLHPDLLIDNDPVSTCISFKLLRVMFEVKFTFEKHIWSVFSSIAHKIGILRKSYKIFEGYT